MLCQQSFLYSRFYIVLKRLCFFNIKNENLELSFFGDNGNPLAVFIDVRADFFESRLFQKVFKLLCRVNFEADFGKIFVKPVARLRFVDDEKLSAFFESAIHFGQAFFYLPIMHGFNGGDKVEKIACEGKCFDAALHHLQTSRFYRAAIFSSGRFDACGGYIYADCVYAL